MTPVLTLTLLILPLGGLGGPRIDTDSSRSQLRWSPADPTQGAVVLLSVSPRDQEWAERGPFSVTGSMAGQPLRFEPGTDGSFYALAAIPVGTVDSVQVSLLLEDGVWTEQLDSFIPVAGKRFSSTQLSVNPRFTSRPDSVLAARIAAERDTVQAMLRESRSTPRMWASGFVRPRTTRVTSDFGQRRMFNGTLRSRHWGTDLDGDVGAPVIATNRGIVALVGDHYYAGGLVYLDHGGGLLTAYMHLSEISVAVGDTVARGEMIGRVGSSGRVTGPHLHWLARVGPVLVDPMSLLGLDLMGWMSN